MRNTTYCFALVFLLALSATQARADLSNKQARRLIANAPGFSLPTSAVHLDKLSTNNESQAEGTAQLEFVFRLTQNRARLWSLKEIRTGQERWEPVELMAQATGIELVSSNCSNASPKKSSALTVTQTRCLVSELFSIEQPSDAVRVKEVNPFWIPGAIGTALAVTLVKLDFRFVRDKGGWRVSDFKSGDRPWSSLTTTSSDLDTAKRSIALNELNVIASALNSFRKDRGSYVISDKQGVLIDHLSPQYLRHVTREDPWHRPYRYEGAADSFTLRSLGPDGKPNTSDDVVVTSTGG
jgi:hypothetical protein